MASSNELKNELNSNLNTANYTSSIYINNSEDLAKSEKFKTILNTNPINLEELQKASWKGIPKSFRPICWKLLSVCIFNLRKN